MKHTKLSGSISFLFSLFVVVAFGLTAVPSFAQISEEEELAPITSLIQPTEEVVEITEQEELAPVPSLVDVNQEQEEVVEITEEEVLTPVSSLIEPNEEVVEIEEEIVEIDELVEEIVEEEVVEITEQEDLTPVSSLIEPNEEVVEIEEEIVEIDRLVEEEVTEEEVAEIQELVEIEELVETPEIQEEALELELVEIDELVEEIVEENEEEIVEIKKEISQLVEPKIFFELNETKEELKIHALVDEQPLERLEIEDLSGQSILVIERPSELTTQSPIVLDEEPQELELSLISPDAQQAPEAVEVETLFEKFPEGQYMAKGITVEGEEFVRTVEITHLIPAPVEGIEINGQVESLISKEKCDKESIAYEPIEVEVIDELRISWDRVTMSHPNPTNLVIGSDLLPEVAPVEVQSYELRVVAPVQLASGEELETVLSVEIPSDRTSMTLPIEFIEQADEFKYQIIVKEENRNQTVVESCFEVVQ